MNFFAKGNPSPAENGPPERVWREQLRVAARAALCKHQPPGSPLAKGLMVSVVFFVKEKELLQPPDIDNLDRPVLDELKHAGIFSRGFPELHRVASTKRPAMNGKTGAAIDVRPFHHRPAPQGFAGPIVSAARLRSEDYTAMNRLSGDVAQQMAAQRLVAIPPDRPVMIAMDIHQVRPRSIKDLLKCALDALQPLLGRDPNGKKSYRYTPLDGRVVQYDVQRVPADRDGVSVWWR